MSLLLRLLPLAAVLGAWASFADREADPDWTTQGFAASLRSATEKAEAELREAPEVEWAEVSVRSIDDHAPLRVEAFINWTVEPVADARKEALLAAVRSLFDSFACVEVVTK